MRNESRPNPRKILTDKILDLEEKILLSHQEEQAQTEKRAVEMIKENPKYFFAYAKSKSTLKVRIGPLKQDGELHGDNHEMANVLNNQYKAMFSTPRYQPDEIERNVADTQYQANLANIEITMEDIVSSVKKMSTNPAAGLDGIPAVLLKRCCNSLKLPTPVYSMESFTGTGLHSRANQTCYSYPSS